MRRGVMDAEEERLRLAIAFFEKIDGFFRDIVCDIICAAIRLAVVKPYIIVVISSAEGVCLPIGVAFLRTCAISHVPFSGEAADIAGLG